MNLMEILQIYAKVDRGELVERDVVEATDVGKCYLEKLRSLLINRYEQTSVSTINSGIAGDTIYGMQRHLYRDVIRYQPDLVIINGSLNWGKGCGDTDAYKVVLTEVVKTVKKETKADIVLLTPNMELPSPFANPHSTLLERVQVIRELAETEKICLADVYKVWETYEAAGYPVVQLLANGMNHPSVAGHELYA